MSLDLPKASLPEAVAAGLAGFPVAEAGRALGALHVVAEGKDPASGWHDSALTGDGFPLELGFTTADAALRWTFDPAGASKLAAARLEDAFAALNRLGRPVDQGIAHLARSLQMAGEGFGGWIGGRHDQLSDGFKLYVELPDNPAATASLTALGLPTPRLAGAPVQTRMLGFGPEPGRAEVYFRTNATRFDMPRLLAPAGRAADAAEIVDLLETVWGHRIRDRMPGGSVGVSYASGATKAALVVTIFLFARALWGGDGRVRKRMLQRLDDAGKAAAPYAAASQPVASRQRAQTRHGMVGVSLAPGGIHWSIGLRPVLAPC